MFPFTNRHSITRYVDELLINELRVEHSAKYLSFVFFSFLERMSSVLFCAFIFSYIGMGLVLDTAGESIPHNVVVYFVSACLLIVLNGVIAMAFRKKRQNELEQIIFTRWNSQTL